MTSRSNSPSGDVEQSASQTQHDALAELSALDQAAGLYDEPVPYCAEHDRYLCRKCLHDRPNAARDAEFPVYIKRIQQTALPGYNHLWFGCQGCDLQGDMTGLRDELDEVLQVLGAAHAARHRREWCE